MREAEREEDRGCSPTETIKSREIGRGAGERQRADDGADERAGDADGQRLARAVGQASRRDVAASRGRP